MSEQPKDQLEIRRSAKSVDELLARISRAISPKRAKVHHLSIPILIGNPDDIPMLWSYNEELENSDALFRTPAPEERVPQEEELSDDELDRIAGIVSGLSDEYKDLILESYVLPQLAVQMAIPEVSSILASAVRTPATASPIGFDSSGVSRNMELILFVQMLERFGRLCPDLPKEVLLELQLSLISPNQRSARKMLPSLLNKLAAYATQES